MKKYQERNVGSAHVPRIHMLSQFKRVLCAVTSNNIQYATTQDAEKVTCQLCIKKMAGAKKILEKRSEVK